MKLNVLTLFLVIIIIQPCFRAQDQDDWSKSFYTSKENFSPTGSNKYFILQPGYRLMMQGEEYGENIKIIITVLEDKRIIDGVNTSIVEEREYRNGKLAELSKNFMAFYEADSGIYYFGEEVDLYQDGRVTGHRGSWQAGKDSAKYGLIMPGFLYEGYRYYQELAPRIAMDRAEIVSVYDTLTTPAGEFSSCLKVEETTPLDPEEKEYKVYAPGVGLIKDGPLVLVAYGYIE